MQVIMKRKQSHLSSFFNFNLNRVTAHKMSATGFLSCSFILSHTWDSLSQVSAPFSSQWNNYRKIKHNIKYTYTILSTFNDFSEPSFISNLNDSYELWQIFTLICHKLHVSLGCWLLVCECISRITIYRFAFIFSFSFKLCVSYVFLCESYKIMCKFGCGSCNLWWVPFHIQHTHTAFTCICFRFVFVGGDKFFERASCKYHHHFRHKYTDTHTFTFWFISENKIKTMFDDNGISHIIRRRMRHMKQIYIVMIFVIVSFTKHYLTNAIMNEWMCLVEMFLFSKKKEMQFSTITHL